MHEAIEAIEGAMETLVAAVVLLAVACAGSAPAVIRETETIPRITLECRHQATSIA